MPHPVRSVRIDVVIAASTSWQSADDIPERLGNSSDHKPPRTARTRRELDLPNARVPA
jgi:hypothetical protein